MNKTEREKVTALERCRLAWAQWDIRFVRNLAWMRDNDPTHTLSPPQKWGLDCLVYKYRRQLGGMALSFDIPAEPPKAADYGAEPKAGPKQANIFGGEDKPRRTQLHIEQSDPQRELF